jgi:hypothetical protein
MTAMFTGGDSPEGDKFLYDPKDYPDAEELERIRAIVFPVPIPGMTKADETHTLRAVHILRVNHRKFGIPAWITWLLFKQFILDPAAQHLQNDDERQRWQGMVARFKDLVEEPNVNP